VIFNPEARRFCTTANRKWLANVRLGRLSEAGIKIEPAKAGLRAEA
jgi:hypothetical protein